MEELLLSSGTVQNNANGSDNNTGLKSALFVKRDSLKNDVIRIDADVSKLQDEFAKRLSQLHSQRKFVEEAIQHVDALLRIESGEAYEAVVPARVQTDESVEAPADIAFNVLEQQGKPMHYREIAVEVKKQGINLVGKDPAATLLTKLSRDDRFKRIKRGTYALSMWKVRKTKSKSRRS